MILAIETTMDETGVAVVSSWDKRVRVWSNVKASSAEMHKKYGGVVPEIAAREQVKVILPVIKEVLETVREKKWEDELKEIEAIAVAYGPGMMGSLLVGVETAKVLASVWGKKLIKVNHLVGHVAANWIKERENTPVPELPAVSLIVSGGHTDLVVIDENNEWKWLGGTRDDAAGEAFDKSARLLGLSDYLGGVVIEKAMKEVGKEGMEWLRQEKIRLPRPMIGNKGLDMSFSGLKTAVLHEVEKLKKSGKWSEEKGRALAKEFNGAVVDVLVSKTERAIKIHQPKSLLVGGGVAANILLRERLERLAKEMEISFFKPEMKYCTDNAAMIGAGAVIKGKEEKIENLKAEPSLGVVD